MSIVLDMTPTAINRTAIFHIALDTARAWRRRTQAWRYGDAISSAPIESRDELSAMAPGVLRTILADEGLYASCRNPFKIRRSRPGGAAGPMLFFDPLYVLFDELRAEDSVLVLDLSPLTNPEWHNDRVCELYHAAYLRLAASGARVLTISHHSAMSLWANFGVDPRRVAEIPLYLRHGVGSAAMPAAPDPAPAGEAIEERRLLCVGSLETRKNISGLMLAFERTGLARRGYTLSIVGGDGHGAEAIKELAQGIRGVRLHGYVPDAELQSLYRTSIGFAYPSFLEGFGVPILEAMASGLPILTAITGAPPDVAGPHAVLVDPYDVPAIARGLEALVEMTQEERAEISAANRARAAVFTFERYLTAMEQAVFPEAQPI